MIRRVRSVNMAEVVQAAVASTVKDYEQLQKLQMLQGEDSKGNKIGKYRSPKYAAAKHAMNPLAGLGNMDFKLTGDFYKGFFTKLSATSIMASSSDKKLERLLKINKDVFGLGPVNKIDYSISHVKPAGNKIIKRIMAGNGV